MPVTVRTLSALRAMLGTLLCTALVATSACGDDTPARRPSIGFLFPVDDDVLQVTDDVDEAAEGFQIDVQVAVLGYGRTGRLTIEQGDDESTVAEVAVDGDSTYLFSAYTLPVGDVELTARLLSDDGLPRASATISVTVEEEEVIPPPAEPSVAFVDPIADDRVLTSADDTDGDPFNGVQYDVIVKVTNRPEDSELTLQVAGGPPEIGLTVDGQATFEDVSLPSTGPAESAELVARLTWGDGESIEARRTVIVDVPCWVRLEPELEIGACEFDAEAVDANPDREGLQADFVVETNCSQVTLTFDDSSQAAFASDGQASFRLTLDEGDHTLRADVSDPDLRPADSTGDITFFVDTVVPVVELTEPDDGTFVTPADDLDPASDGIQLNVGGTADGAASLDTVEALVDGSVSATGALDPDGTFLIEGATVATDGFHDVRADVIDGCGNLGSSNTVTVDVRTTQPALSIQFPSDGGTLLAADDAVPGGDLETEFLVDWSSIEADTEVGIRCFRVGSGLVQEYGTAAVGDTTPLAVPVVIPNGSWTCRAQSEAGGQPVVSTNVTVTIDTIVPTIIITEPADQSATNVDTVVLAAFVGDIDDQGTVTYQINDDDPVEVTLVDGGFTAQVVLAQGDNTLTVTATDGSGNAATASVVVRYDIVAPTLTFIAPPGSAPTIDSSDPGFEGTDNLYDVVVESDEVTSVDPEICLTINTVAERCEPVVAVGAAWQATFTDTFMQPGDNDLDVRADDDAGNEGTAHQDLTYDSTLPRLEITTGFALVGEAEVEFTPLDGSLIATSEPMTIVVDTDNIPGGSKIELLVNGVPFGAAKPAGQDFDGVVLLDENDAALASQDGWNHLIARLDDDTSRTSPLVRVRIDTTAPSIAFADLVDDAVISLAEGYVDESPAAGFQTSIDVVLDGVENGRDATLTIDCSDDAFDAVVVESVGGPTLSFLIDIPLVGACTLTAEVSDRAGNEAPPAEVDVTVDVEPPIIAFVDPIDGDFIDFTRDIIVGDGIQMNVRVSVTGGVGSLDLTDDQGAIDEQEAIPTQSQVTVVFAGVSLPEGELQLSATAEDTAGNVTVEVIDVTVVSSQASLAFFGLQPADVLNSSDDTLPSTDGFQGDIQVTSNGNFNGETVILCRRVAFDPGDPLPPGTLCSDPQFEDIASALMSGTSATFTDVPLPEGSVTLQAELLLGDTRVVTVKLTVFVDSVQPTVLGWTLDNDVGVDIPARGGLVGAGDGALNLVEAPTAQADVTITFDGLDGDRSVSVFSSLRTTAVATGTTTGDTITLQTNALPQGAQTLSASTIDINGNPLDAGAAVLVVTVDTVAPGVTWIFPPKSGSVLADDDLEPDAGAQLDVDLLTTGSATGMPVDVTGMTVESPPLTVAADRHARGRVTIAEGDVDVSATAYDAVFNATTSASTLLVDVTAPTIDLIVPGPPVSDVDPGEPGFQVDVTVDTTQAEVGQTVVVRSNLSGGGIVGQADISSTSGGDLMSTLMVRLDLPVGTNTLTAQVSDVNTNMAVSDPEVIDVTGAGCGLVFNAPLGNPVLVDATGYSGDPLSDPKTIDVTVSVTSGDASCVDGAEVVVRIGCPRSTVNDDDCARHYAVNTVSGVAFFDDVVELFDGEETTLHAISREGDVSTTEQKTVLVDLVPPIATITTPGTVGVDDVLGLRLDEQSGPTWESDGSDMIGPLEFTVDDADGGTYTVRYSDGTVLTDGAGPISGRAIADDDIAGATIDLSNVRYPSRDESLALQLEVTVSDVVGNLDVAGVAINVDSQPPTTPASFDVDQSALLGFGVGAERSGEAVLDWNAATDDPDGAGGSVARYEIRALCTQRPGCATDWTEIDDWEAAILVAEESAGTLTHHLDLIGFDEDWRLGLRAFDEADNWSAVIEGSVSTRLSRTVIAALTGLSSTTPVDIVSLGDVNGDDLDDLLASGYGLAVLMLGEADPENPLDTPLTLTPPGSPVYFGSSVSPAGDVNGDGLNDFAVGSFQFGADGDNRIWLYFGSASLAALTTADVAVDGPAGFFTEASFSRAGFGNYAELGGVALADGYDDFFISAWNGSTNNVYVVLGRATGDWPDLGAGASLAIATGGTALDDNCAQDIMTITGVGQPAGVEAQYFGMSGGMTTLNDDDWTDLVLSTRWQGGGTPVHSVQYIYYGGSLTSCPTDLTLQTPDAELVNAGSSTSAYNVVIGVHETELDGAGLPSIRGLEYAAGQVGRDAVEVVDYDAGLGLLQTIRPSSGRVDLERFGEAVNFAGDLDQDPLGQVDLIIGAPGHANAQPPPPGRVYALISGEAAPRFGNEPDVWLDVAGVSRWFGTFLAAGLDYNGDGYPDVAVVDYANETVTLLY